MVSKDLPMAIKIVTPFNVYQGERIFASRIIIWVNSNINNIILWCTCLWMKFLHGIRTQMGIKDKKYWHIHIPCYIKRKRSQPIPHYRYINDILEINTIPILVLIVKGPSLFDSIIRVVPLICCKGWKARKQRLC